MSSPTLSNTIPLAKPAYPLRLYSAQESSETISYWGNWLVAELWDHLRRGTVLSGVKSRHRANLHVFASADRRPENVADALLDNIVHTAAY